MLSRCHGTNGSTSSFRILSMVDFDAYVLVRRWMFSTTLDKRVKFQSTFLFRELWLDVDVTGPTAQCCRGVHAYLKTNDGSGERETRLVLNSHNVFHVLDSRLRWTPGRKKRPAKWTHRYRRRSGAFEGVAVQGRRLSRRSGPLRLEIAG